VIKEGLKISELIRVSYDISNSNTKKKEIRALIKAQKELSAEKLTLITWDYEGEELKNGVKIRLIPLWKWLIQTQ